MQGWRASKVNFPINFMSRVYFAPFSSASKAKRLPMDKHLKRQIANSNERKRMQSINAGFLSLRAQMPHVQGEKLSKVSQNLLCHVFLSCNHAMFVCTYLGFYFATRCRVHLSLASGKDNPTDRKHNPESTGN